MTKVSHTQPFGPFHHSLGNNISRFLIQINIGILPRLNNLLIPIFEHTREWYANFGTLFWSISSLNAYIPKTSSISTLFDVLKRQRLMWGRGYTFTLSIIMVYDFRQVANGTQHSQNGVNQIMVGTENGICTVIFVGIDYHNPLYIHHTFAYSDWLIQFRFLCTSRTP